MPEPIAIVGLAALFPGSLDEQGFWRDIVSGRDLITEVPERRWLSDDHYDPDPQAPGKTYCRRGAFLSPVEFDPFEFGLPPNALPATDTCQLLALVVAKRVLDDVSRSQKCELDRERASVILGVTSGQELFLEVTSPLRRPFWVKALRESGLAEDQVQVICDRITASSVPWQESTFPGMLGNVVAGRIANRFDLHGTNCVTDAACASSLAAVSMAVDELRLGRSNFVLAGGADTFNDISMFVAFSKTPALSPTGDCRPFSDRADGTLLGEGFGMFALKRLSDAERDGNHIYAVIRGIGSSSDGKAKSIYAPLPSGQARAMKRAYEDAGFGPEGLGLMEAHGTGTAAGDQSELESLHAVFSEKTEKRQNWCALGSIKSQVGHTKAAAGAAGLFKIAMAVHQRVLPPTIKVDRPNPQLQLEDSPFYLNTRSRPWVTGGQLRRAAVSSFGFGGTNFHVVLEEYAGPSKKPPQFWAAQSELMLVSAETREALQQQCRELADKCADPRTGLAALGLASQISFRADAACRLAVVAATTATMAGKLRQWAETGAAVPGTHHAEGPPRSGKVALLFPGQGSQYPWMGADIAIAFPQALEVWEEAPWLSDMVFPRAAFSKEERDAQAKQLARTEWAQPSIGAASAALLSLLDDVGLHSDAVAGHSFGELTALYAAGGLDRATLLAAARRRGELMAESSSEPAGMLSVNVGAEQLARHLNGSSLNVVIANHNSPRQSVLSGLAEPLAHVRHRLTEAGFTCTSLPVSSAFHSALMKPAATGFAEYLSATAFKGLRVPMYSNLDGTCSDRNGAGIAQRLAEQIAEPVQFQQMIERMYADGIRTFVEVGPRDVLSSLVRSILADQPHQAIALDRQGVDGVQSLWEGLGQLSVAGIALDYQRLRRQHRIALPHATAPPKFSIPVDGGNLGRPYPPAGGSAALPPPNLAKAPVAAAPSTAAPLPAAPTSLPAPLPAHTGVTLPESSSSQPSETLLTEAYKVFQDSLSRAQQDWQASLSQGHESFLRAMEGAYAGLLGDVPEQMPSAPALTLSALPSPPVAEKLRLAVPHPVAAPVPPQPQPTVVRAPETQVAPPPSPTAPRHDLQQLLTAIIAEKTGFPVEMLEPSMALEADLGIDSIKRVEIFSELQEQLPHLPEMDPSQMGTLRTLAEIVALLHESLPETKAPAQAVAQTEAAAAPSLSLGPLLKRIVAEKTGYPVDMLDESMALEADLGIDSIKRVEIFSALQEELPHLPELDPAQMGTLRTLHDIVAALAEVVPVSTKLSPLPEPLAVGAAPASGVASVLTTIIAEKTGYPVEMLSPSMELEGDLGIDSIKRVEIFSALQEQMPHLPEMEPAQVGALRTIEEIVAALGTVLLPSSSVSPQPADASKVPERYDVVVRPAMACGHATLRPEDGAVVISPDGRGIDKEIAALLSQRGFQIAADDANAGSWICLAGIHPVSSISEALAVHGEALQVAQRASTRLSATAGAFVTVQDTGGDFASPGDIAAWSGGLAGLARTAALEWPQARVKAIDIALGQRSPREVAEAIVSELLEGGPEVDTGLKVSGERVTVQVQAARHRIGGSLPKSAVVLATGGARGVTAASLIQLARASGGWRIALLGRTPLNEEPSFLRSCPDEQTIRQALIQKQGGVSSPARIQAELSRVLAGREVRQTIALLQAAGCEVRYLALDGRDAAEVAAAAAQIRSAWGPITGIVHGAGVLADKRIADLTPAQFEAVFSTKTGGLRALLDATAEDPLKFLVLFSSVAARYGNFGQAAYAMANEVLNKVALAEHRRRGADCLVKSINWGPWDGGMVTPSLARHFEQRGVSLIQLQGGAQAFVNELQSSVDGAVEVVIGAPLPAAPRELRIHISRASHPHLEDHQIRNEPVLPVVEALKLVLQLAEESGRTLTPQSQIDIRVLRGVHLTRFFNGGDSLVVRAQDGRFELLSGDGIRHYEARIQDQEDHPAGFTSKLGPHLDAAPWSDTALYPDLLFHGPEFQVIQQIHGISEKGIAGTLQGRSGQAWRHGTGGFDPGMLDGGLQLALLWARHYIGQPTLPMRIGALRLIEAPADQEEVTCHVLAKSRGSGILCDFEFRSASKLLATMKDVELYAVANL